MLANYDIEPVHLRTYELNYELRIRSVATDRVDISLKRKYLKRELKKDLARPEAHIYTLPNFDFEVEKRELNDSIKSVTELVDDYDGINLDLGHRIRSRINHILGRLGRLPEDVNDDISNYRGDNIVIVSALEGDLDEISEKNQRGEDVAAAIRTRNVHSSDRVPKSVAVYKWPIKFDGRLGSGSVNSFLQRVDELRIARKCSKEELFEAASDLFEDLALEWFRAQLRNKRFNSWDSLVSSLRKDFLPLGYDEELWKQIEKRTQHEDEPVVIYISIMENIFECLSEKPSEERKLRTLMSRVLPRYQSHLALQDVSTVSQLVQICRALEESEKAKKCFKPPPRRQNFTLEPGLGYNPSSDAMSRGTSKREINKGNFLGSNHPTSSGSHPTGFGQISALHCRQCDGVGHLKRDSWKKPKGPNCYNCGKRNVIKPNCPNCSKNVRRETEQ